MRRNDPPPRVIHRDDQLLVVLKPPGLPTTAPDDRSTLVKWAQSEDPGAHRLHPSSRLDAEVSGIVVFARTDQAIKALLAARRAGAYERLYVALAPVPPEPASGEWNAPIAIARDDPRRRTTASGAQPQEARTLYATHAVADHACLLHLRPQTGRTHQLRVHASHAGTPLLGDVHYGGARRVVQPNGRVVTIHRVMLHCARVDLPAVEGAQRRFEAPALDDMVQVWTSLGGDRAAL